MGALNAEIRYHFQKQHSAQTKKVVWMWTDKRGFTVALSRSHRASEGGLQYSNPPFPSPPLRLFYTAVAYLRETSRRHPVLFDSREVDGSQIYRDGEEEGEEGKFK